MKLACCDIGNTKIKIGTFEKDIFLHLDIFNNIKEAFKFLRKINPDALVISSVVPKTTSVLNDFSHYELGMETFVIDYKKKLRIEIDYATPETLGIDRICTSEGAFHLYTKTKELNENEIILIADLGTASTFSIVKYPNKFSGGIIAPGPGLLFKAMKLYTAQLPESSFEEYSGLIGNSTQSCIASGVMNAVPGLIERIFNQLSKEFKIVMVYLTGGNASRFADNINVNFEYKPELLITGMKAIYDYNTSH